VLQTVIDRSASAAPLDARLVVQIEPCSVSADVKLLGTALRTMLHIALDADRDGQVRVEGQKASGDYSIALLFKGATVSAAQLRAMFLEVRQGAGSDAASELLPGLGYVARLATLISCSLSHAEQADGLQSLKLMLPKG
jgi:hypothetical protein